MDDEHELSSARAEGPVNRVWRKSLAQASTRPPPKVGATSWWRARLRPKRALFYFRSSALPMQRRQERAPIPHM